jgi:hypothetical protein
MASAVVVAAVAAVDRGGGRGSRARGSNIFKK